MNKRYYSKVCRNPYPIICKKEGYSKINKIPTENLNDYIRKN